MLEHIQRLFERDIQGLLTQVGHYPDDASLWQERPGWTNPGGTLVLHLVGNLRHYIGAQIGGSGYVRDREAEFASRAVTREALLALVRQAAVEVSTALSGLDEADLQTPATERVNGQAIPMGLWLMHLLTHLAYHLGQIDYHRRAVTGEAGGVGTLSFRALAP